MKKDIIAALKEYATDPIKIDRLVVSLFVYQNNISVKKNGLIRQYLLPPTDKNLNKITAAPFSFEDLIEVFEFVVSPKEKIVTGAVYTPQRIREFIISNLFPTKGKDVLLADISCGCGGFLIDAAKKINELTGKDYCQIIEENIWGLDIADYSIQRSKLALSLLALSVGEDRNIKFNLFVGNALTFQWKNDGFDIIVGNPPYVCSRNIDTANRNLLGSWEVTSTGHPDLYIPFFQIALENLKPGGTLGYITVNTFFKSINGRALRKYFGTHKYKFKIIDFLDEQVFSKRNTYTCICILSKKQSDYIEFLSSSSNALNRVEPDSFAKNYYKDLDDQSGWNLGDESTMDAINKIEQFPNKIFPKFSFSTGIATLKNDVYKFNPHSEDAEFYFFEQNGSLQKVEKGICREIINANKVTTEDRIGNLKEKIIFPYKYKKKYELLSELEFKAGFPFAYQYLTSQKKVLGRRDKGEREYETWYAYGRSQGLNINGIKLFLPHITNNPTFVLCNDKKLLFCNGEAIVSEDERELLVLKRILESKIFYYYMRKTSKPYSSGYFSLGKNYLKQFSIPELNDADKDFLLNSDDASVFKFLSKRYGLTLPLGFD